MHEDENYEVIKTAVVTNGCNTDKFGKLSTFNKPMLSFSIEVHVESSNLICIHSFIAVFLPSKWTFSDHSQSDQLHYLHH